MKIGSKIILATCLLFFIASLAFGLEKFTLLKTSYFPAENSDEFLIIFSQPVKNLKINQSWPFKKIPRANRADAQRRFFG